MHIQAKGRLQGVLCAIGLAVLVATTYSLYVAGTFQAWYAVLWMFANLAGVLGTRRSRCALKRFPPLPGAMQFGLLVVLMAATAWAVHGRLPDVAAVREVMYLFFPFLFLWEGVVWFYRRF